MLLDEVRFNICIIAFNVLLLKCLSLKTAGELLFSPVGKKIPKFGSYRLWARDRWSRKGEKKSLPYQQCCSITQIVKARDFSFFYNNFFLFSIFVHILKFSSWLDLWGINQSKHNLKHNKLCGIYKGGTCILSFIVYITWEIARWDGRGRLNVTPYPYLILRDKRRK